MSRSSARRAQAASSGLTQEPSLTLTQAERLFYPLEPANVDPTQKSLMDLLSRREDLDREIAALKAEHRKSALIQITNLIQLHNFTAADLFPAGSPKAVIKRPPKYRNLATGEMWSGRGKAPHWYRVAEDKDALLITNQETQAFSAD
jgi:DNA-binding protein H-NS